MNEKINQPRDCISLLTSLSNKRQEHFGIICLDSGRNVVGKKVLFIGADTNCLINRKIVFWEACKKCAAAIILFHNHPGGTPNPSTEDLETTIQIQKACEIMGMQLLDHVIISRHSFFSFLEHDLLEHDLIEQSHCKETKVAE